MSCAPSCSTRPRSTHCRHGPTRSRRGRPGRTCGATTPSTPRTGRGSVAPRTCRRAIPASRRSCPACWPTARPHALGEPVTAFKDKVNYKQPGGAGFSPHQDKVAYPGVGRVMSILVAIDDCSVESGCLWSRAASTRCCPSTIAASCAPTSPTHSTGPRSSSPPATRCASTGSRRTTARRTAAPRPRRVLVASYAPTSEQLHPRALLRAAAERMRDGDRARRPVPHQHARRLRRRRGRDRQPRPTTARTP